MDYDNIEEPKEYKYALSVTSQFFFCGIPFRLDTTPKCALNCKYCFAMAMGGRNTQQNQIANPEKLKNRFDKLYKKKIRSINDELLIQKVPVHFGGMSDPFANKKTADVTKELLKILSAYDYPVVLSTKNTKLLLRDEILDILSTFKNLIIQISISSPDNNFSSYIEPYSPTPEERINSIKCLTNLGIPVFVRLQPYLSWREEEIVEVLIPKLSESNVTHVSVEFLKLPNNKKNNPIKSLSDVCEFDISSYYEKMNAISVSREWLIPPRTKWDLLQPVIEAIHKYGMSYGAADYGLNHLGDTECCCGVDLVDGFEGFFKNSFAHFIRKSPNGNLFWNDFPKESIPEVSIKRYMMSHSRLSGKNSILAYLENKWNRPGTINAPDSYLGVSVIEDYNDYGYCVYHKSEV